MSLGTDFGTTKVSRVIISNSRIGMARDKLTNTNIKTKVYEKVNRNIGCIRLVRIKKNSGTNGTAIIAPGLRGMIVNISSASIGSTKTA